MVSFGTGVTFCAVGVSTFFLSSLLPVVLTSLRDECLRPPGDGCFADLDSPRPADQRVEKERRKARHVGESSSFCWVSGEVWNQDVTPPRRGGRMLADADAASSQLCFCLNTASIMIPF